MKSPIVVPLALALLACQPNTSGGTSGGNGPVADASKSDSKSAQPEADTPTPAQPEADTKEVGTDKPAADAPKQRKQAPKPKRDEAQQLRRDLLKLLNEGRALTKQGDYAGGIAKYREALKIDASDASVLGELGWAAYKSGDLVLADQTTTTALAFVRDDKRRGMLLYNLGRIEEDRKHTEAAIEHYKASLIARPGNATVQGRLDALLAAPDAPAPVVAAGPASVPGYTPLPELGNALADLAGACKTIVEQRCEEFTMGEEDTCVCESELLAAPGADQSWGLVLMRNSDIPEQRAWFPVVQTDKGWTVFDSVLYEYNPGAFGIFEEATLGDSRVEPLLAAGTQLVMRVFKERSDRDMGLNEIEFESTAAVVVCSRDDRGAHCTRPLIESYRYKREVEFDDFEEEGGEPIDHEGLPIDEGFAGLFALGEELELEWMETYGNYDKLGELFASGWVLAAGKYKLAELLG